MKKNLLPFVGLDAIGIIYILNFPTKIPQTCLVEMDLKT